MTDAGAGTKLRSPLIFFFALVSLGILLVGCGHFWIHVNVGAGVEQRRLVRQPAVDPTTGLTLEEEYQQLMPGPAVFKETLHPWHYECWAPTAGTSSPELTIVTILGGLPAEYVKALRLNRLHYAALHRHRYCELATIDRHRIPAWTKLPWMLALLPCTEFVYHVDADAFFYNFSLPLKPFTDFMVKKNIHQMLSTDVVVDSPINFGVFMLRPAPWLWKFYRLLYNHCTCDWSRTHDWPAEQGIIYDLLASRPHSEPSNHTLIVPIKGWNHILTLDARPDPRKDVVVHIPWPYIFPKGSDCGKDGYGKKNCKMTGLMYFLTDLIPKGQYNETLDPHTLFSHANNTCQQVWTHTLFKGSITYSNQEDIQSSSVMQFEHDPKTGQVQGVTLGEVGCLGWRDKKCSLPQFWDTAKGTGPWPIYKKNIV